MSANLSVRIGKLTLKNPVMVASGTFGYAEEFKDFVDLKELGAIVTKTVTMRPRQGNPMPRTCETAAGLLNSIGLENPGFEVFLRTKLAFLKALAVPVVMSIAAEDDPAEFVKLAKDINDIKEIAAIELNISCPNIRGHRGPRGRRATSGQKAVRCRLISQDPQATYALVRSVRKVTRKTLITKLSPNVTCISDIAAAAEKGGSDAVSLINTLSGMSIDVRSRRPKIACVTAGLSGPAIRPVAVRMVWETFQKVHIPIIGMGGIADTESAVEFFLAGATAVSVGTANFINPSVTGEIIAGLKRYLAEQRINAVSTLIGAVRL